MAGDQRRLAAIVVADVVGYSRLMGQDESGTLSTLKAVLREVVDPKVAEHSGRLVKTMGDGLLLEFSSAVNAVRCSVDIQRAMVTRNADVPPERLLQFRIGINLGDIIIEGDDIFGDGVNVAARLQTLAERGGICVSKAVRDQVQGKLDVGFDALGARDVKNIAHPVDVYRVRLDSASIGAPAVRRFASPPSSRWLAAGVLTLGLISAAVWMLLWPFEPENPTPPALSVALATFVARADDAAASRFAGSLMRHFSNELPQGTYAGRVRLMARGSTVDDVRQARRFRYLIEGDVGHDGGRFDVHVRLLDAATGDQVWSTRIGLQDADLAADLSKLNELTNGLRSAVFAADTRRAVGQPLSSLSAPELLLRAWALLEKDQSLLGFREALKIVDDAIGLDPEYAPAWAAKALLVNGEGDVNPHVDRDRLGREQDHFSARAVVLDPSNASAWQTRSNALIYLGRWDAALEAASRAIKLDPSAANHRLHYAWIKGLMGRPEESLSIVGEILRTGVESASAARVACDAHVLAGHAAESVTACEKAALSGDWIVTLYLVAAYANNGDMAKAKAAKAELLRVVPGYTIAQLRAKRYSDHPDYLVLAEKNWYSGLRKAGIPEK